VCAGLQVSALQIVIRATLVNTQTHIHAFDWLYW